MAGTRETPSDGSALIIGLLLATLVIAGTFAWQAQDAALSHRALAERVLRDYAELAADELVRRSTAQIGYSGYYLLLQAVQSAYNENSEAPLPTPEMLVADARLREGARHAASLAHTIFAYDPQRDDLICAGPALSGSVSAFLRAALREPGTRIRDDNEPMRFLHRAIDGVAITAVLAPVGRGTPATSPVVGFVVAAEGLAAAFARVLDAEPLLPPSLGGDAVSRDDLSVQVLDLTGATLFASAGRVPRRGSVAGNADAYAPRLYATRVFGDTYGGAFKGASVRVAIDPAAAPKLVIGGLPRSRLPLLLGLLLLTTTLVAVAIVQLRRAHKLTRLRSDFVSEVSHELRTPLTQIRMFAETLLLGRVRSDDEGRQSLSIIDREARRLGNLVENILQFSRGERGALELAREVQPLGPLLREVVDELAPLLAGRDTQIETKLEVGVEASVDSGALRQILLNLLDNAIKYGPRGQTIRLELKATPTGNAAQSRVTIVVEDEGPGVPERERERIWRSFRRLDRDRDKAIAGTGIGLAVVRQLVEGHGGRAWAERGARTGARFVVELPGEPLDETSMTEAAALFPEPAP